MSDELTPEQRLLLSIFGREEDMCEDCGCWTGGAACPYCVPGAPHPRERT